MDRSLSLEESQREYHNYGWKEEKNLSTIHSACRKAKIEFNIATKEMKNSGIDRHKLQSQGEKEFRITETETQIVLKH